MPFATSHNQRLKLNLICSSYATYSRPRLTPKDYGMPLSSRSTIAFASLLTLLVTLAMSGLALSPPQLEIKLALPADAKVQGLQVAEISGENAHRLVEDEIVTAFHAQGQRIPASAALIVEEPDTLPSYADYQQFMQQQDLLAQALHQGTLQAELADGRQVLLATRAAELSDLPFLFWFQIFVGAAGVLTGCIVLALSEKNRATWLYALTGLGYLIFAPSAAVYSTRELALTAETFRTLSIANHFGALFFTASLTALLWHYPRTLGRFPAATLCYLTALGLWLIDTLQIMQTPMIFHLGVLGIFLLSFVFAFGQWLRTRGLPADRAALRWFLLSIYLATGLFAGTIIIPAAFNLPLPAPQGVMFGAFLIMYWGLALGVVRYRLFKLEEWWYSVWSWFLSGVAVVLLDFMLIGLLHLEQGVALSLAVALVGWLYFPVRQWLWSRLGRAPVRRMQDWLPAALPLLIQMPEGRDRESRLQQRWPELLSTVFAPLAIEKNSSGLAPAIVEDGLALRVPDVRPGQPPLLLRHADGGARLFTTQDLTTLLALRRLFDLAIDLLHAHEAGAGAERERIARDIHDDLGAKLLSLLYRSKEEDQPLVREAIICTRELINTLNLTAVSLPLAVSRWQTEIRERLEPAQIAFSWKSHGDADSVVLNARQNANLTRILREALTNAIKHAAPQKIETRMTVQHEHLQISLRDDGRGDGRTHFDQGGRGAAIMQARAAELGGSVQWIFHEQGSKGCEVLMRIPLGKNSEEILADANDPLLKDDDLLQEADPA